MRLSFSEPTRTQDSFFIFDFKIIPWKSTFFWFKSSKAPSHHHTSSVMIDSWCKLAVFAIFHNETSSNISHFSSIVHWKLFWLFGKQQGAFFRFYFHQINVGQAPTTSVYQIQPRLSYGALSPEGVKDQSGLSLSQKQSDTDQITPASVSECVFNALLMNIEPAVIKVH